MSIEKDGKTYYTLSGEITEDTLSIEERREIHENIQNGTVTDKDRERLMWDDSLNEEKSTTGMFSKDREKYNPNVEYYMLDYWCKVDCRWVRSPYMTMWDLLGHLREVTEDGGWLNKSGFRIQPERELDMKVKMECKEGEIRDFTLREVLFDDRYERISELSKTDEDYFRRTYERRNPVIEDSDEEHHFEEDEVTV